MGQNSQYSKLESQSPKQAATPARKDQDQNQDMQKKQAEERARKLAEEQKNKASPKRDTNTSNPEHA